MRILVLASTFPRWRGDPGPPFVHELSKRLAQRGHVVHVLAPHAAGAARREVLDGVMVHRYRYGSDAMEVLSYGAGILENLRRHPARWLLVPGFLALQLAAAIRLMRRERVDVVHAHWVIPQGVVAALTRLLVRRPIVITAHGGDVYAMGHGYRRRLLRFAARRADACTAVSTVLGGRLEQLTGMKSTIIPMGVDPSIFAGRPPHRRRLKAVEERPRRILFVGRLVEKKGVEHALRAMSAVRVSVPGAELQVVGDGPERARLVGLAAHLGLGDSVQFVGSVSNDQLPAFYASADVFVAPSVSSVEGDTEGLPVVLLEAAASGVPIVASQIGGVPDLVRHEYSGLLVSPGDPGAIAAAVVRVLHDPALGASVARRARKMVTDDFSWDHVVGRFESEFRSVVGVLAGEHRYEDKVV